MWTGVQWVGVIDPNATHIWFTWGWPASLHVVWYLMPISPLPGGPEIDWEVAVERSDSKHCTYWITVKNRTSKPVTFEGRFAVLS